MRKITIAVVCLALLGDAGTSLVLAQSAKTAPKPIIELNGPCNPLGDTRPQCQEQGSPAPLGISPTAPLGALWARIVDKDLPADLTYAKALADAAATPGSKLRSQCYAALLTANQQANGSNLKDGNGNPLAEPNPNLFSELEKASQVIDNLQPTSPVVSGCAPAAQALKMDVLNFINTIVTGAAIKTLTAGVLP